MNIKYSRGSEWRRWDLHFHTPSSYDYSDKSITDKDIVKVLKDNDIVENLMTVYNKLVETLPRKKDNIRNVKIKLTMGKPLF